jgi:hypothetical protein
MVNRAIAATIGILLAGISFAPDEGYARSAGGGGGGATAHGPVALVAPRPINRGVGPGSGGNRVSANPTQNFAPRRDRRFRRFGFPGWPVEDCEGCYGALGGAEPYDYVPESYDYGPMPYDYGAVPYDYGAQPHDYGGAPYDYRAVLYDRYLLRPFQPGTHAVPSEFRSPGLGNTSDRGVTGDYWVILGSEPLPRGRWHVLHRPWPEGEGLAP